MIPYEIAEQANKTINESVEYKTDLRLYGKLEHWTPAVTQGDCEDYALAKRKKFLEFGIDPKYLRLATAKTETGKYHAVLIVTTDKGDYVLDNRYPFPMERRALNYKWDKIQQGDKWYKIA